MSETSHRERRAPRGALIATALVAVGLVVVGVVTVVATRDDEPREAKTVEIVVPKGTAARMAAGETIVVMPSRLELRVGDVLRVRNDDTVDQSVGPYFVRAGEEFELRYGEPGVYTGYCPLTVDQRYEIVVEA